MFRGNLEGFCNFAILVNLEELCNFAILVNLEGLCNFAILANSLNIMLLCLRENVCALTKKYQRAQFVSRQIFLGSYHFFKNFNSIYERCDALLFRF